MTDLRVVFRSSFLHETAAITLVVSVLDHDLETVAGPTSVRVSDTPRFPVGPGVYVVHVDTPAGDRLRRAVTVESEPELEVGFDLHMLSGHETLERTALLSGVVREPGAVGLDGENYASVWARLWRRGEGGEWRLAPFTPTETWRAGDGVRHKFSLPEGGHFLQIGGPRLEWRLVAVPARSQVTLTVLPDRETPGEIVVAATADNDAAESLLGFMTAGSSENAEHVLLMAEDLLFGKFDDPIAATIGAYYLLRMRRLQKLAAYAPNLAGFRWLPDGAVINAWQHIEAGREQDDDAHFELARDQLIEAVSRGTPIFTEGLRLLLAGLRLFPDDAGARDALEKTRLIADVADWTASTVTYPGTDPSHPSRRSLTGLPAWGAGVVFVGRPGLDDLLRTGWLLPGTMLRFAGPIGYVMADGTLRLATGQTFADPALATDEIVRGGRRWFDYPDWTLEERGTLSALEYEAQTRSLRVVPGDPMARLGLSRRPFKALDAAGLRTVDDLLREHARLGDLAGVGPAALSEIASALSASDLRPPVVAPQAPESAFIDLTVPTQRSSLDVEKIEATDSPAQVQAPAGNRT